MGAGKRKAGREEVMVLIADLCSCSCFALADKRCFFLTGSMDDSESDDEDDDNDNDDDDDDDKGEGDNVE